VKIWRGWHLERDGIGVVALGACSDSIVSDDESWGCCNVLVREVVLH
jgi:hypothetical protein